MNEIDDLKARVAKLDAWVEVVMRTLACLGLENVLIELDEARASTNRGYPPTMSQGRR